MTDDGNLPEIPGLQKSYRGYLHDMDVSVSPAQSDSTWTVELNSPYAFHDGDDFSGVFATEREALLVVKEFAETGQVPSILKQGGFWRRQEEYLAVAELEVERDGLVPDEPMELEEWLKWTGKDPEFVGSPSSNIPGSFDLWEAANRVIEKRRENAPPAP